MKKFDKLFHIISLSICSVLFIGVLIYVCINRNNPIDNYFFNLIFKMRSPVLTNIMKGLTIIGSVYFLTAVVILLVCIQLDRKDKIRLLLFYSIVLVLSVFLKFFIKRIRPEGMLIIEHGYSFPSAHALLICFVFSFLIYLLNKHCNKIINAICVPLCVLTIIIVGFSRLYLGVHYFLDVVAGMLLGVIVLNLSILLVSHKYNN